MATTRYDGTLLVDGDEPTNRALLDLLKKINEVSAIADRALSGTLPPIGYVYTQGPDDMSPAELWPTVTWENVSSEEAGSFRRYEGGAASAFGSGNQGFATEDHTHGLYSAGGGGTLAILGTQTKKVSGITDGAGSFSTSFGGVNIVGPPVNPSTYVSTTTAAETRPVNYTVRKWRRTA